jgi:hypothetical protein
VSGEEIAWSLAELLPANFELARGGGTA